MEQPSQRAHQFALSLQSLPTRGYRIEALLAHYMRIAPAMVRRRCQLRQRRSRWQKALWPDSSPALAKSPTSCTSSTTYSAPSSAANPRLALGVEPRPASSANSALQALYDGIAPVLSAEPELAREFLQFVPASCYTQGYVHRHLADDLRSEAEAPSAARCSSASAAARACASDTPTRLQPMLESSQWAGDFRSRSHCPPSHNLTAHEQTISDMTDLHHPLRSQAPRQRVQCDLRLYRQTACSGIDYQMESTHLITGEVACQADSTWFRVELACTTALPLHETLSLAACRVPRLSLSLRMRFRR